MITIQLHYIHILIHLLCECFYSKIQIYTQMICADETTLSKLNARLSKYLCELNLVNFVLCYSLG